MAKNSACVSTVQELLNHFDIADIVLAPGEAVTLPPATVRLHGRAFHLPAATYRCDAEDDSIYVTPLRRR